MFFVDSAGFGAHLRQKMPIYAAGSCCIPRPLLAYDSRCRRVMRPTQDAGVAQW